MAIENLKIVDKGVLSIVDPRKDESRGLFMCPITQDVLVNPVVASDGYTYSRPALKKWAKTNVSNGDIPRSPFTRQPLLMDDSTNSVIVAPNKPVRDILKHLSENDPHLKYEESGVAEYPESLIYLENNQRGRGSSKTA